LTVALGSPSPFSTDFSANRWLARTFTFKLQTEGGGSSHSWQNYGSKAVFKPGGSTVLQQARDSGQWIKEGKQVVKMTRIPCHRFRSNEVRLALSLLAYPSRLFVETAGAASTHREVLADELQERLVKTGERLVKHAFS
jgi:hypothetical protein